MCTVHNMAVILNMSVTQPRVRGCSTLDVWRPSARSLDRNQTLILIVGSVHEPNWLGNWCCSKGSTSGPWIWGTVPSIACWLPTRVKAFKSARVFGRGVFFNQGNSAQKPGKATVVGVPPREVRLLCIEKFHKVDYVGSLRCFLVEIDFNRRPLKEA